MLARRFSLPPVTEALYDPKDVPACDKDMTGTVIVKPPRDQWMQMLGEMVQVWPGPLLPRIALAPVRVIPAPLSLR